MAKIKIEQVATRAGVSRTAVSFAFNYPERLSAVTRERILSVAAELGYTPDPVARSMKSKRIGAIGFLVPQGISDVMQNEFFSEFLEGVGEVCDEEGIGFMLVPPLKGSMTRAVANSVVDGFLTIGLETFRPAMQVLYQRAKPFVMVDSDPEPNIPCVNIDDEGGAYAAMRHVIEAGHRQIVIFGMQSGKQGKYREYVGTLKRRMAGYRRALREAGLSLGRGGVRLIECEVTPDGGRKAFAELWTAKRTPTAVVAMGDAIALGVLEAAAEAGVKVPDELSVVGFDDVPAARWARPPLTTVHQSAREKGKMSALFLLDLLAGKEVPPLTVLPTQLVVRESVVRPKQAATGLPGGEASPNLDD